MGIMSEEVIKAIEDIIKRGNDAEIRRKGDGYVVLEVKTAKHSGFYITVAPKAPGPKKRRLKWHLHANF